MSLAPLADVRSDCCRCSFRLDMLGCLGSVCQEDASKFCVFIVPRCESVEVYQGVLAVSFKLPTSDNNNPRIITALSGRHDGANFVGQPWPRTGWVSRLQGGVARCYRTRYAGTATGHLHLAQCWPARWAHAPNESRTLRMAGCVAPPPATTPRYNA